MHIATYCICVHLERRKSVYKALNKAIHKTENQTKDHTYASICRMLTLPILYLALLYRYNLTTLCLVWFIGV